MNSQSLKTGIGLNYIYELSSYLTENKLRVHYKEKSVTVV